MRLKKETRMLLVDRLDDKIVAIVIRGYAGVESIIALDSCPDLNELLRSRKGIAAEVNYVLENSICRDLAVKTIALSEVEDEDIVKAVEEAMRIASVARARYARLRIQLCLRA